MFGRRRPGVAYLAGAPLLIAHRGGAGLAPENTMAAFETGVRTWGADVIELDLRVTRDGVLVVFHDPTVDRTTDGSGVLRDLPFAELSELDAGYRFLDSEGAPTFRGRGIRVPRFEEVLEAFPGQRITAELKEPEAEDPFLDAVLRHDAAHRVVLATIEERNRAAVRGRYPGPVSASKSDIVPFWAMVRLGLGRLASPRVDVLQLPEFRKGVRVVSRRLVRAAHRLNLPVHVWTVDDEEHQNRLLDWGVDGILTDRPDRLARVLHERVGRPLPPGATGAA